MLGYAYGNYQVYPTSAPNITAANPRPAAPPVVGGSFRVASFYYSRSGDGKDADAPDANYVTRDAEIRALRERQFEHPLSDLKGAEASLADLAAEERGVAFIGQEALRAGADETVSDGIALDRKSVV